MVQIWATSNIALSYTDLHYTQTVETRLGASWVKFESISVNNFQFFWGLWLVIYFWVSVNLCQWVPDLFRVLIQVFVFGLCWHCDMLNIIILQISKAHNYCYRDLVCCRTIRSYLVFVVLSLMHDSFARSLPRCCFPSLGLTWWRGSKGRRRRNIPWHSVSHLGRLL